MVLKGGTMNMNNKHSKTYKQIYENPVKSDIEWQDIEAMLAALGAKMSSPLVNSLLLPQMRTVTNRMATEKIKFTAPAKER